VFLLFKSIEAIDVPIAILSYFVYPLLTGFAAAVTGLDRLTWRGGGAAPVAFCGLGVVVGGHPADLSTFCFVAALRGALWRGAVRRIMPRRDAARDTCEPARRRSVARDLVFADVIDCAVCLGGSADARLAVTHERLRLGRSGCARLCGDGRHSRRLCVDRSHR